MPSKVQSFCERRALQIVRVFEPTVLFCESIGVFDRVKQELLRDTDHAASKTYMRLSLKSHRLYSSFWVPEPGYPTLVIGVSHLTGTRLSGEERDLMADCLKEDLSDIL